jgi:acetoin utilization deacetylase AcuC-like enzyme
MAMLPTVKRMNHQLGFPRQSKGLNVQVLGVGTDPNILLLTTVQDSYLTTAKDVVVPKAHKLSYIKRLKMKIALIGPTETGAPLTEDSEGNGGNDTNGSRGSYTAAFVEVAVSLMAVDMVVSGQCVNAFCAVRPPGHHTSRGSRAALHECS